MEYRASHCILIHYITKKESRFATKSESETGTGLGLFISKSIVEAHGGRIWAENIRDSRDVFILGNSSLLPKSVSSSRQPLHTTKSSRFTDLSNFITTKGEMFIIAFKQLQTIVDNRIVMSVLL